MTKFLEDREKYAKVKSLKREADSPLMVIESQEEELTERMS